MNSSQVPPIESVCLALPAFNEAGVIQELLRQAAKVLPELVDDWSIVVVDDGSVDRTAELVEEMMADNPRIRLVRHERNLGLGPAIITGLKAAIEGRGEAVALDRHLVVSMDADLTHPPETIPSMIEATNQGADVVIASRFRPASEQHGVPLFRKFISLGARLLFHMFLNLKGVRDYTCGFRAIRASLIRRGFDEFGDQGLITRSGFACTDELLVHLAMLDPVICEVPFILRYDRKQGPSKMNLGVTILETLRLLKTHRAKLRRHQR